MAIGGTRCSLKRSTSLAGELDTLQMDANCFSMSLLDRLGRPFVYESPPPLSENRRYEWHLFSLPNRLLRKKARTTSHYSKAQLVKMILEEKRTP